MATEWFDDILTGRIEPGWFLLPPLRSAQHDLYAQLMAAAGYDVIQVCPPIDCPPEETISVRGPRADVVIIDDVPKGVDLLAAVRDTIEAYRRHRYNPALDLAIQERLAAEWERLTANLTPEQVTEMRRKYRDWLEGDDG